jgi:UDP-glucose 4-epimerase
MKILVTGGAGFIGSHLVDAYIAAGHDVVVVDDLSSGKEDYINEKAIFVEADLADAPAIETLFYDHGPFDLINHLAAQKSVTHSVEDPLHDADINIIGLLTLMQLAVKNGVKRVIFSSTGGAIYGAEVALPTPETAEALPASPYGITKLASEHYLRYYRSQGITTQVLRYSNVYGPRQDPFGEAGVVAIFCKKMLAGEAITIYGDGEQTRDFVYVKDVVAANLAATAYDKDGIWNIGTGKQTSVNQLAEKLVGLAKADGHTPGEIVHAEPRLGELKDSVVAIDKAKTDLGWSPAYTIEDGLSETLRSFA